MLYPCPAVMISCADADGRPNIMTAAWAGTICSDPVMVSVSIRPERYSYGLIHASHEFVINLTDRKLARAADYCGVRSGRDVDKFREMGLTPAGCSTIGAPMILESPVAMECAVTQEIELGSHVMFLAKVTAVSVDEKLLEESGRLALEKADLVAYSHGEYFTLGDALGRFGFSVRKRPVTKKNSTGSQKKRNGRTDGRKGGRKGKDSR